MKNILIIVFVFIPFLGIAQNNQDDVTLLQNKIIQFEKSGNIYVDDYFITLEKLASIYKNLGVYKSAEYLYLKELDAIKQHFGKNHPYYSNSLNNLALFYEELGKYSKAESAFKTALEINKNTLGEKNQDYIITLSNLANLYLDLGKYSDAESMLLKGVEISKKLYGDDSINYAISLSFLASCYKKEGKYTIAEPLFREALDIQKNKLGDKHPTYIATLNNLAGLYNLKGEYSKAETLFLEVVRYNKIYLNERHPNYLIPLNNLASLYQDQGKHLEAENLYLKILEIQEKTIGERNINYLSTLHNLATLYKGQAKYSQAITLFLKELEIGKEVLGENHPNYILGLLFLADTYQNIGWNEKSSFYFEQYVRSNQNRIIGDIYGLSEKDLIHYINFKKEKLFSPFSFLNDFPGLYPEINSGCYTNELLLKNLSLRNNQRIRNSIQKSGNNSLKVKYEQFLENKKLISKLEELPLAKRPENFASLTTETSQIEKELTKESSSFSEFKKSLSITWINVKDKLKKDEIFVDLVAFNYLKKRATDSIVYAAFTVKKGIKSPVYIALFEQNQLDSLLSRDKNQKDSTRIDKQYTNKAISNLFLKPLQKELEGITTIYLSPTGLGHQIDFAALPVSENQTLGEKYKLHLLSSPAELVDYKATSLDKKNGLELLLYGGIDYDNSNAKTKIDKEITGTTTGISDLAIRSGISGFSYLQGTNDEVEQIKLKGIQNGFTTTIFNERKATEESIKQLDGRTSTYVLHLATHGFFFPDPKQENVDDIFSGQEKSKIYKASDDPMMRSGLLFAGANNYWGKPNENASIENGIMTASEISNLDLSACQLVVLSACETGLGETKGSEGVFGLQRAFKMAGVKNIIMSLWKVPDTQTAELFEVFYGECFAGKTIHEAFQIAQSKMKAKHSPYYWAGFVLLE